MSDIEALTKPTTTSTTQQEPPVKLKPLYRQFTHKLVALLFTILVMVGVVTVLFYHSNIQNKVLISQQLVPLTQQLKQIKALQKADQLITNLLNPDNAANFVSLHTQLITANQQLLSLNNAQTPLFQQWLNDNQLSEDTVSRIQDSDVRNQQLKQNGVTQLQLVLFSLTTIIDKTTSEQQLLNQQLQAGKTTFNRINNYTKTVQQLSDLQQLHRSLTAILAGFNGLSMYTPMTDFELLAANVESVFTQNQQLKGVGAVSAEVNISQQMNVFEKIVLTEQNALAKWQGYIRLAQSYQLALQKQQQKIKALLTAPFQAKPAKSSVINDILNQYNIQPSDTFMLFVLLLIIGASLLLFCYLLWLLRRQINVSAQQSVTIIARSLQPSTENNAVIANCAETQQIIQDIQNTVKPKHSEQEFQGLLTQYQTSQEQLEQQQQTLTQLTLSHEQQQLNLQKQLTNHFSSELQCYQYIESLTLAIMQQQQLAAFTPESVNDNNHNSTALTSLYKKLAQFQLALAMKTKQSVLTFNDVNFIDELHVILLNQQKQQQALNNQLLISYSEQLLPEAKIDLRLFQQLFNVLIDITLAQHSSSQWHLNARLKDKNAGQQQVHFVLKVTGQAVKALPHLITQLLAAEANTGTSAPLIALFTALFTKLHGENITAQLIDNGYQLCFDLPLAIAPSTTNTAKVSLENTKLMLLSNNKTMSKIIEDTVLSANGKCENISEIERFKEQLTAKHLNRHPLDFVVVTSDIALGNIELINQQINALPPSLKPKLMVLQSSELNYEHFGFYSQAESIFCKDNFLLNLQALQTSNVSNNQLIARELFVEKSYVNTDLPLLLAVQFPQQYQNLQRLLHWLGFKVDIVSHQTSQQALWKTGQYSLLITEFADTALVAMVNKPLMNIAVFSLTSVIPSIEKGSYFNDWHIGQLEQTSSLDTLANTLSPWIKPLLLADTLAQSTAHNDNNNIANILPSSEPKINEDSVITEVPRAIIENNDEVAFNFPQYLQHQGSVDLALFMLDDYALENYQQLDALTSAIKEQNIVAAKLCVTVMAANARILSAPKLQLLCATWLKLLQGKETSNSLKQANVLLNETRMALNEIDEYAATI